jgi:hypothetical protein
VSGAGRVLVVTGLGRPESGRAVASAIAVAGSQTGQSDLGGADEHGAALLDLVPCRPVRPALLASAAARALAATIDEGSGVIGVPRGHLCRVVPSGESGWADALEAVSDLAGESCLAVHVPPPLFLPVLMRVGEGSGGAAVVVGRGDRSDPRLPLAVSEARALAAPTKVWVRPPGSIGARRALAGLDPGGGMAERARAHARTLLGARPPVDRQEGQALPGVLGLAIVVVALGLALAAFGGALTGKARAQRAADLAAVSAARVMRDDFDRLFVPATLPDGFRSPRHLSREEYLSRAREAAREAVRRNGGEGAAIRVRFPDRESFAPLRVRVTLRVAVATGDGDARTEVEAEAAVEPGAAGDEQPKLASGGGYSGPLAYRQGEGMRPDVATAFDRMAAAARRAGISLVISSGFRSDAEQARLFAQNPDPRWVAPPGRSLHRCGTELDLGPASAYGWLAANAPRFGLVRRYSWEPWHFGYDRGPAPCSAAADRSAAGGGDGRGAVSAGLPAFVPRRYRVPLLRSAGRHGVSAALLAAQIIAESNFNPYAVSPAGARGISQFMPATAAAYGLRDPFDPVASIDAQARMMSELLERFGSTRLALAAYNAGPGAVAGCGCVPPYAETQGYVARILGLLGAGEVPAAGPPALEVRLVR